MKTASVELNGIEMHYETAGVGEPLLLLHGGTGCRHDWIHSGQNRLASEYALIIPDARGHGNTNNPLRTITHRQCALDTLALLDHLAIAKCRAIGLSMGGNILLHMATMQPGRISSMVAVSAAPYFPEQAREIMRQIPAASEQPPHEWERMRQSHKLGDEQITRLWDWVRELHASYDDMTFTPPDLARITASTLVVYGDRDPLYPLDIAMAMFRAIPTSALWVVPNGGHVPVFGDAAVQFAETALGFFRSSGPDAG